MVPLCRVLAAAVAFGASGLLFAQAPAIVVAVKLADYRQTSATDLAVNMPSYGINVTFTTAVPASTVVQLVGPVSLVIPRTSGTLYELNRSTTSDAVLDLLLPDRFGWRRDKQHTGRNRIPAAISAGPADQLRRAAVPRIRHLSYQLATYLRRSA